MGHLHNVGYLDNVGYLHNGILLSVNKEGDPDIYYNTDEL